ncbi:hypothetical protein [Glycomyces arizonensis]|uniref:hypothetical protein n=1 Tax=Glycomyces arizonensis TaxID=256035 RepID=UPI0012EC8AC4|nr:hypothetical protein [Glycomyces arizonensis]
MLQIPAYRTTAATTSGTTGAGLRERFEAAFESDCTVVATGRTAAWIHGFDVLPPGVEECGWPLECASDLPEADTTVVDGLPVTHRSRTLVDCAADLPRLEAVAAADQFLRAGIDARGLAAVLERVHGDRLRRANATLLAADPRAESPMESWTRCLVADSGLPAPVPQLRVRAPGGHSMFLDLGWEEWKVGVEYDGMAAHACLGAETGDRRRHRALCNLGWQVLVLTATDVMEHPRAWLVGLREALLERGWRPELSVLHDIGARIDAVDSAMSRA